MEGAILSIRIFPESSLTAMYCLRYKLRAAKRHIAQPSISLKGNCPVV